MAARGHFVFPIDAKNHKVIVIWDLNGYGEYDFDWCICDKVTACTSVTFGVYVVPLQLMGSFRLSRSLSKHDAAHAVMTSHEY